MSLQPILIAPYDSGLQTNKKPFLLIDSAFQTLENAFVWRERVKKRDGIKLIARLRRVLLAQVFTNPTPAADTITIANIFTDELAITGEANAQIEPGTLDITVAAPDTSTFTDNGDGTFAVTGLGLAAGSFVNYATGAVTLVFTGVLTGGAAITANINYFPSFPVMGISIRELAAINVESSIFFDRKYAYSYDGNDFIELTSAAATTWQGSDSDFFWATNYRGVEGSSRLFFATNFNNTTPTNDPIRHYNGTTWTALTPLITATDTLFQCRIIIPYYGRLLLMNTWEGTTAGGAAAASNFFSRCRFSQIGDPTDVAAWRADQFGRGGFIDAPTNEAIVSATFYKNTLIVFFERTTWVLQYVGEYGLPFVWERISSDLGSESTFSTVLFDDGVLAVGDKAIIAATNNNTQRIDLEIPDTVYTFKNESGGKNRVQGIRDFQKEIVYWCYADGGLEGDFPDKVLIYNYRNKTWAMFRDNITAFGQLTTPVGITWDSDASWDEAISWETIYQGEFPAIVSGNQQGYIHYYQYPVDPESDSDSNVNAIENESLSITAVTRSATAALSIQVNDHNLRAGEVIFITGMLFIDTSDSSTLTTSLNDRIYNIDTVVDSDNVTLGFWNFVDGDYDITSGDNLSFTPATGTGTYVGGGEVTLLPKLSIRTKDFNPFQNQGKNMMISYIDFQTDATSNAAISVELTINSNTTEKGNLIVGSTESETSLQNFGNITGATQADPCQITSPSHGLRTGDTITIKNVLGMVELNADDATTPNNFTITFVDLNNFTLDDIDSTAFTTYDMAGNWTHLSPQFYYIPGSAYAWHRFYSTVHGQYITVYITYDGALMNIIDTHQQKFEMNAMKIWTRAAGRTV